MVTFCITYWLTLHSIIKNLWTSILKQNIARLAGYLWILIIPIWRQTKMRNIVITVWKMELNCMTSQWIILSTFGDFFPKNTIKRSAYAILRRSWEKLCPDGYLKLKDGSKKLIPLTYNMNWWSEFKNISIVIYLMTLILKSYPKLYAFPSIISADFLKLFAVIALGITSND